MNLFIFQGKLNCDDVLIEVLPYQNITLKVVRRPRRIVEVEHFHPNLHLTDSSEAHSVKVPSYLYTLVTSNVVHSYRSFRMLLKRL